MINKIQQQIEENYNIAVKSLSTLQDGSDNLVLKVNSTTDSSYVLRISKKEKIEKDILFEVSLSEFLSITGLPVAKIIKTKNNDFYCLIDNKNAVLFSFCTGSKNSITPDKKPSIKIAYNGGVNLAQLHRKLIEFYKKETNYGSRVLEQELLRILKYKDLFQQKFINAHAFIEQVETILNKVSLYKKNTIIHNDFRIQNLLFNHDNIVAILDFDWACPGNNLKDLAHALVEWSFPDGAQSCWDDIFNAFLQGYESIFGEINKQELKDWMLFSCLSDTATYLMDRIDLTTSEEKKEIRSYMYKKYLFFKGQNIE